MMITSTIYGLEILWKRCINLTFNEDHSIFSSVFSNLLSFQTNSIQMSVLPPPSWFRHDAQVTVP